MSRNGENIHKRKDGRWEGRYITARDAGGRAIYRSVYGKTYNEAKEKLQSETIKKQSNTEQPLNQAQTDIHFQAVLEEWLTNNRIRYKDATYTKYKYMIEKHITPQLGAYHLTALNAVIINSFLNSKLKGGGLQVQEPLSPSYVRTMALVINAALNYAITKGLCQPLNAAIYKPAVKKTQISILSHEQCQLLNRHCTNNLNLTNMGILISLYTGLRIGEICALRWSDIDLANALLHVNYTISRVRDPLNKYKWIIESPKTASSLRAIPLSERLITLLLSIKPASGSEYVISEKDQFMNPRTFEYRFHKELQKCSVPTINYHGLRHTFATRCVEGGMDIKTLSEILGHSNVTITLSTYVHSSLEMKKAQIQKVEKYFSRELD